MNGLSSYSQSSAFLLVETRLMMRTTIILGAISVIIIIFTFYLPVASAQRQVSQPAVIQNGILQNIDDGFMLQVPGGWVVQDINNTLPANSINSAAMLETGPGTTLAIICPHEEALPGIGRGVHNCEQSDNAVHIIRYFALDDRPEFAGIGSAANITPDDFLGFLILELQAGGNSNIEVVNSTDTIIPVTNPEDLKNTETRMVPAKQVELTYNKNGSTLQNTRAYYVLALETVPFNAGLGANQIVIGYKIAYEGNAATRPSGGPSIPVQQIFDSLKIIESSSSATGTGTINRIDILELSAIQGNPDYDPEVLIAKKGAQISVVNQDTVPHTVTSGTGSSDPNSAKSFDTSIINGGESATVSLAQVEPGQYDYYCMIHPYMTGKITVG